MTPGFDKVQQFFDKFDFDDDDNQHEVIEKPSPMEQHAHITNLFYGNDTAIVLKGLNIIKFNIYGDELSKEVQERYLLKTKVSVQLNVQMAPDYVKNPVPPTVAYKKPEINPLTEKSAFGEQLESIAKRFTLKKWASMHDTKFKPQQTTTTSVLELVASKSLFDDPKIKCLPATPTVNRKEQLEFIVKLLKENKQQLASAIALYFSDMKIDAASLLLKDAGSDLPGLAQLVSFAQDADDHENYFLDMITFLILRLPTITENCVICDDEISCQLVPGKPTLCTKFMCQFDYVFVKICSTIPMVKRTFVINFSIRPFVPIIFLRIWLKMKLLSICYQICVMQLPFLVVEISSLVGTYFVLLHVIFNRSLPRMVHYWLWWHQS